MVERDWMLRTSRALLVLGIFLVPCTAIKGVAGFPLSDTLFLVAAFPAFMSLARPRRNVPATFISASFLATASTLLIVFAEPQVAGGTLNVLARLLVVWLLLPIIARSVLINRAHVRTAVVALFLGCGLSAAAAVGNAVGITVLPAAALAAQDTTQRLVGLNTNPNGQGGVLSVGAAIGAGLLIMGYRRWWVWLTAIVIVGGVMLSGSITGTIASALGLLVVLIRSRVRLRSIVGLACLAIPAWYALLAYESSQPGVLTPFQRLQSATGTTGISTVRQRELTIQFAWAHISHNPLLGIGFGDNVGGTYNGVTGTHNMLVLAWYQGGFLLLLAVIIVSLLGVNAVRPRTADPTNEALFAAVVAAVFFANTGPALIDRYIWLPVILAVTWRAVRSDDDAVAEPPRATDATQPRSTPVSSGSLASRFRAPSRTEGS